MDFEAQRKLRSEAMQDKKKRLEELKKMRQQRAEKVDAPPTASPTVQIIVKTEEKKVELDNILSSLIKPKPLENAAPIPETQPSSSAESSNSLPQSGHSVVLKESLLEEKRKQLVTSTPVVIVSIPPVEKITYDKEIQTDDVTIMDEESCQVEIVPQYPLTPLKRLGSPSSPRKTPASNVISSTTPKHDNQGNSSSSPKVTITPDAISAAVALALGDNGGKFADFLNRASKYMDRALTQSEDFDIMVDYTATVDEDRNNDNKRPSRFIADISLQWGKDQIECADSGGKQGISPCSQDSFSKLIKNRPVLYLHNNDHFNELYVISYGENNLSNAGLLANGSTATPTGASGAGTVFESRGIVCVWSVITPRLPEMVCHSVMSPVLVVKTNPFNHKQIIGGCENGQILIWDMGSSSASSSSLMSTVPGNTSSHTSSSSFVTSLLPIQRTSLSGKDIHKYPICNFSVIEIADSVVSSNTNNNSTSHFTQIELITISTDGWVCHWDLSSSPLNRGGICPSLQEPLKSYYYKNNSSSGAVSIGDNSTENNCTCAVFASPIGVTSGDHMTGGSSDGSSQSSGEDWGVLSDLYVGNERGQLTHALLPPQRKVASVTSSLSSLSLSTKQTKHTMPLDATIEAHFGMITGLSFHSSRDKLSPSYGNSSNASSSATVKSNTNAHNILKHLLLTISFDWKIKLWDTCMLLGGKDKKSSAITDTTGSGNDLETHNNPALLYEIMNPAYDYVCDVQWSPTHPAMFATISSNNYMYLWNIVTSTSEPIESVHLSTLSSGELGGNESTNTRVSMVATDNTTPSSAVTLTKLLWNSNGKVVYVGSSEGMVYGVHIKDAIAVPGSNEENALVSVVLQHRNAK